MDWKNIDKEKKAPTVANTVAFRVYNNGEVVHEMDWKSYDFIHPNRQIPFEVFVIPTALIVHIWDKALSTERQ